MPLVLFISGFWEPNYHDQNYDMIEKLKKAASQLHGNDGAISLAIYDTFHQAHHLLDLRFPTHHQAFQSSKPHAQSTTCPGHAVCNSRKVVQISLTTQFKSASKRQWPSIIPLPRQLVGVVHKTRGQSPVDRLARLPPGRIYLSALFEVIRNLHYDKVSVDNTVTYLERDEGEDEHP